PTPVLPDGKGWKAVLEAVPYALWWLVVIEAVALAAEEAHEPHRTIPRGLVWAQLTLIGLVVLTWLLACGAMDSQELADTEKVGPDGRMQSVPVDYPLLKVVERVAGGGAPLLGDGFGGIPGFGRIASYPAILFGTSRQAFPLGRAGYLPAALGTVHAARRTPVAALLASSLLTAGFVIASGWWKEAVQTAVLVSTLTALIWYVLAVGCLFVLRRREPQLFGKYQTPVYPVLPLVVGGLAVFPVYLYSVCSGRVAPLTAGVYTLGLAYYLLWARRRIKSAAPEELGARP